MTTIIKKTYLLIIFMFSCGIFFAQDTLRLTLNDAVTLAQMNSLDAFRAKYMYLTKYWDFNDYKAERMPNLSLDLMPASYFRTFTKRYDFDQNIDIYRQQRTLENKAAIYLTQNIGLTGGSLFITSDIARLMNFDPTLINYNATFISVGYKQPVFGYNKFKWQKKIEPLKFDAAKKQYIKDMINVKLTATSLFFNLLLQYRKMIIAENNLNTSTKLYEIAKQKFELLAIEKQELLNLQLNKYNAQIELHKQKQLLEQADFKLKTFLKIDSNFVVIPQTPQIPDSLYIDMQDAIEKSKQNNPDFLLSKQTCLEADANLDKQTKESRFNANILASVGLNQQADNFNDVYKDPMNQEIVVVSVQIPIIDWGKAKGQRQIAKMNREIAYIDAKQQDIATIQAINQAVVNFNIQAEMVKSAESSKIIAQQIFQLTENNFINGQTDVFNLNIANEQLQNAEINYIQNLFMYWKYYYEIQLYTLFDYINNKKIEFNEQLPQ